MERDRLAGGRGGVLGGDLDQFRVVVESLADEFDVMQVAMAAVKLAHRADGSDADEAEEIPEPILPREGPARPARTGRDPRGARGGGPRHDTGPRRGPRNGDGGQGRYARLYIGAGREAGIRPQDLVGAITGEAGIAGHQVGAIEIADRFSLVEVAEEVAEGVIKALRASKIKGRKVIVRPDRREG